MKIIMPVTKKIRNYSLSPIEQILRNRNACRSAFRILLKGGKIAVFAYQGRASTTCCTLQYNSKISRGGGGKHPARGENAPPPPPK